MKTAAELALQSAYGSHFEIRRAKDLREEELLAPVKALHAQAKKQLADEFDGKLAAAQTAITEAQAVVDAESVANAPASSPYPIGTLLYEWANERWEASSRALTGRAGVVEVFASESAHPGRQCRPDPGTIVVRPLNKQGKPGVPCIKLGSYELLMWLPKGVTKYHSPQKEAAR